MHKLDGDEDTSGYDNGHAEIFNVRVGPNYQKTGKKEASKSAMFNLVAADVIRTESRVAPIAQLFNRPPMSAAASKFKHECVPSLFVLNLQLPDGPASLFGSKEDGQSAQGVFFFEIAEETIAALEDLDNAEPAYRLMVEYFKKAESDPKFRGRFKLIGQVRNDWAAVGLPGMLETYNGKPVLITQSGTMYTGPSKDVKEMSVNVHVFSYIARKSLSSLRDKFRVADVDVGVVIEGRSDEELPERMLCAVRINKIDPFLGPDLLPEVYTWMKDVVGDETSGAK